MRLRIQRPAADEYPSYYTPFITGVPDGDLLDIFAHDLDELLGALATTPAEHGTFRYAPDKWSVNEVLGHVVDCERIYTYRALRFARGDQTPLPAFDQDAYVVAAGADNRPLASLADELAHVRQGTLAFWRSLDPEVTTRHGFVNEVALSVRALAYMTAGHARHHRHILRERYGIGGTRTPHTS